MLSLKRILLGAALLMVQYGAFAQLPVAIAAIEAENFKDAKAETAKLIAADPTNADNFYWSGVASIGLEDWDGAKAEFQKGVKAKAKNPYNHIGLARVYQHEGKKAEAQLEYDKAKEYNKTDDVNVIIAMGYALLEAGKERINDAEVVLTRAQVKDPKNPKSYIALGDMYFGKGIKELAVSQYKKATDLDAKFTEGYFRLGQMKIKEADEINKKRVAETDTAKKALLTKQASATYQSGVEFFTQAINSNPEFAPAYRDRGDMYARLRNVTKARDDYQKYVALAKKDIKARTQYCKFLYLTESYKEAIPEIESVLKDTTTSAMLRLLGYSYLETGNTAKAKESMEKYFAFIKPEYTIEDDYVVMGNIYRNMNDVPNMVLNYEKAMDKDSSKWDLLNPLIDSLAARKNRATDETVKKGFAADEGKYRQISIDRKLKAGLAKSVRDYYMTGTAFYTAGDLDKSAKAFQAITEFYPSYAGAFYWLGIIASIKEKGESKFGTAVEPYKKVVELLETKAGRIPAENNFLVSAYTYLAYAAGKGDGTAAFNCEAAKPFIKKCLEVEPTNEAMMELNTSCP